MKYIFTHISKDGCTREYIGTEMQSAQATVKILDVAQQVAVITLLPGEQVIRGEETR